MPYWQLFYHIVTATKERSPFLGPEVEQEIFGYIKSKVYQLEGSVYALNGTADHVHLVVSIPPKIAVAAFVAQVKGFSAAQFNKSHPDRDHFAWQNEYGAFSIDKKRLSGYVRYVEQQKDHHRQKTAVPVLERWSETSLPAKE